MKAVFDRLGSYAYEHVFIDNASTDGTADILRKLAAADRRVKVIVNTRNFGHVRSPYHALLQCRGDAVIGMAADLQDPPELIPAFIEKWREGYKVVLGVKAAAEESAAMFAIRRVGYGVIDRLSESKQDRNRTEACTIRRDRGPPAAAIPIRISGGSWRNSVSGTRRSRTRSPGGLRV